MALGGRMNNEQFKILYFYRDYLPHFIIVLFNACLFVFSCMHIWSVFVKLSLCVEYHFTFITWIAECGWKMQWLHMVSCAGAPLVWKLVTQGAVILLVLGIFSNKLKQITRVLKLLACRKAFMFYPLHIMSTDCCFKKWLPSAAWMSLDVSSPPTSPWYPCSS